MKRYIFTLVAAIIVLFFAVGAEAAVFSDDISVLISTAEYKSMNITVTGDYYVKEAPDFDLTTDNLSIWMEGSRPVIRSDNESFSAAKITLINKDYSGTSSFIGFYNAEYGSCTYLGNMQFSSNEGSIRAINTLPIEHYLYGVVPYEMSSRFPVESLKAQAVCARSYAAAKCAENRDLAFDILDTPDHQVYYGYNSNNVRAILAVDETSGQVVTSDGAIIQAFYTASNGGQTELTGNVWSENLPYYTQKDDIYDLANPDSPEQTSFIPESFSSDTIELMDDYILSLLQGKADSAAGTTVGLVSVVSAKAFAPLYKAPSRSYSAADIVLMVSDSKNQTGQVTVTLDLDALVSSDENPYGVFNLNRPYLKMRGVEKSESASGISGWFLTNRRYGHGVGLSQRGAQMRAVYGQSYQDILKFYYSNTALVTFDSENPETRLSSDAYTISATGIENVPPGKSVPEFITDFSADSGKVSLITDNSLLKEDGIVVTGDILRNIYNDGTEILDLPVVIRGDVSGDGDVTRRDVDLLQWHLLDTRPLKGAYLTAADINRDGAINNADLLMLIWHINGTSKISYR